MAFDIGDTDSPRIVPSRRENLSVSSSARFGAWLLHELHVSHPTHRASRDRRFCLSHC
jgi:hypothetical protein